MMDEITEFGLAVEMMMLVNFIECLLCVRHYFKSFLHNNPMK